MDAAAYNTRFPEEIPYHSIRNEPTTSELEASAEGRIPARFEGLGITRIEDIPSAESATKLHLNDPSLFLALDESIFSTSTISTSAISTPLDKLNSEPFIVPASNEDHAIQDLPEIRVHDEEQVVTPPDLAAKAKNHHAKTILRVVKKAGASARKFAHKTKSLTKRRENKLIVDVRHMFDAPAVPHNTPVPDYLADPTESAESFEMAEPLESAESEDFSEESAPIIPLVSIESLAATLGSPTTLAGFPLSPPRRGLFRSITSSASLKTLKDPSCHSKLHRAFRLLLKFILFLPYALIIGSLPFLAPSHLSTITFSSFFGYVSRPTFPADCYTHHMKLLPCHIGLALGFLGVLNWNLLHRAPLVFAGFNIALVATTWWVWQDFDSKKFGISALNPWELGFDDRTTIYHLFEATVPLEVRQALHGLMQLWFFRLGRRLNDGEEHVRIIVQYDD